MKKFLLVLLGLLAASSVFAGPSRAAEKKEIEAQLKQVWEEMSAKLAAGDVEGALVFFDGSNREKYRKTFADMGKDALASFFSKSQISFNELREDKAECFVVPGGENKRFSYPVSFRREADNQWKIYDF